MLLFQYLVKVARYHNAKTTPTAAATPAKSPRLAASHANPFAEPVCVAAVPALVAVVVPVPVVVATAASVIPSTLPTILASALTTLVLSPSTSFLTLLGRLCTHPGSAKVTGGFVANAYRS